MTAALRVIAADDELQARKRVSRLLEEMPGVELVASCASAAEVLEQLRLAASASPVAPIDVLVLDISMPGMSGLELSAKLGRGGPFVIFATAHAEHALAAFELGVVDYVPKPITAARLAKAIERAAERITGRSSGRAADHPLHRDPGEATAIAAGGPAPRLALETRGGVVLVDPAAILYARFDGALVTVVTALTSWVTDLSLSELAARLPGNFQRTDRRHLLNLDEVASLRAEPSGGYLAVTRTGATVPVSRQAARLLRRRFAL